MPDRNRNCSYGLYHYNTFWLQISRFGLGGEQVLPFGVQVVITMQLSLLSNNAFLIAIKD